MEYLPERIKSLYLAAAESGTSSQSLYDVIFSILKRAIENGDIAVGSRLPSTRKLADELGVSRSTIVQVYDLLKIGNLIESRPGSGYQVKKVEFKSAQKNEAAKVHVQYPALSESGKAFLNSTPYLEMTKDEELAFRPGLPPLDIFPVNQWKVLNNLFWRHVKNDELGYMGSSGTEQLRETLAGYLSFTRKIKCRPEQIFIASGSLQSIYIIGNILLDPVDCVAHENPTFPNVISIFKALRADVRAVPLDAEGMMVHTMSEPGASTPKLIHTAPSCHYPTGTRMSLARRLELIQWASDHNSLIIENDYEHEINNYSEFIPSIYSLDAQQRTFFLGTFNRLLHPSIRVGYMVAPPQYIDAIEAFLRYLHRFVPYSKQLILSRFIEKNYIYSHISNLIEVAEKRKKIFCKSFEENFSGQYAFSGADARSLHLLAAFNENTPDRKLIQYFRDKGIIAHAYSKTFTGDEYSNGLIVGYGCVNETEIQRKIQRMKKCFLEFRKNEL